MARKIENSEELDLQDTEEDKDSAGSTENSAQDSSDADTRSSAKTKVQVVNTPHTKKPLRTPSHILRITLIWCFVIVMYLLSYPFLSVRMYITDDLEVTTDHSVIQYVLASQSTVDQAQEELQAALDGLEKSDEEKQEYDEDISDIAQLGTANYTWNTIVAETVNADALKELIDNAAAVSRKDYTEESVSVLNTAVLRARKVLCSSVQITQSALQMIMGGSIAEAFGVMESLGLSIMHSMFAVTLAVLPFACFLALCFDKNKHIKHIFVIIGSIVCLFVIFFTLYPHVGIGAVLSVIMYILILVLNLFSIYAKQQEDYIVAHPEEEAAFTESHPQFVKALINAKSFNRNLHLPTKQEQETQTARNVKKRQNKKKKK